MSREKLLTGPFALTILLKESSKIKIQGLAFLGGLYALVNNVSMTAFPRQGRHMYSKKMHYLGPCVDNVVIESGGIEHQHERFHNEIFT